MDFSYTFMLTCPLYTVTRLTQIVKEMITLNIKNSNNSVKQKCLFCHNSVDSLQALPPLEDITSRGGSKADQN